jgi:hypothetical protein
MSDSVNFLMGAVRGPFFLESMECCDHDATDMLLTCRSSIAHTEAKRAAARKNPKKIFEIRAASILFSREARPSRAILSARSRDFERAARPLRPRKTPRSMRDRDRNRAGA